MYNKGVIKSAYVQDVTVYNVLVAILQLVLLDSYKKTNIIQWYCTRGCGMKRVGDKNR